MDGCLGTIKAFIYAQLLHAFPPQVDSHSDEVVVRVDFLETRISSGRIDYKSSIIFQLSFIGVKMLENCHFVLDDSNNYSLFNTFVLSTGLGNVIVAINIYIIRCVG